MNLEKIYEYRFNGISQEVREAAWVHIAAFIMEKLNHPTKILEVGAGRCEFINNCGAKDRWALDFTTVTEKHAADDVNVIIGTLQEHDFGPERFDAIFMSNFLEHLETHREVAEVFTICNGLLNDNGKVAVIGPNFKYAYRDYFDCSDHVLPLTHINLGEHLCGAGYKELLNVPRFLPFSFRSSLPSHPILVKWYLQVPLLWNIFGNQFFLIGEK